MGLNTVSTQSKSGPDHGINAPWPDNLDQLGRRAATTSPPAEEVHDLVCVDAKRNTVR